MLETKRLVHELQVHQIEIEMQNEELQRARSEVDEALARYTDLYDLAPVGYLTLGRRGEILQVNLTGAAQLGMERSLLLDRFLGLWVTPETRAAFDAFLGKVFERESKESCEIVLLPEGKGPLTVALTGTAVVNEGECRIAATDITLRKEAEHERELLRLQLAQSQKMEAIGTFAGGIAHDLNNILGVIMGGLSLLDMDLGEAHKRRKNIQDMVSMVDRGADLAKQLLGFARRGKYVESAPGKGAAFTLYLPTTDRPLSVEKTDKPSIKPGRGTILLVDDEPLIMQMYADLLRRIGYDVLTATGGKEAIALLELHREKILLVILDMIMPEMNGRETYGALQEVMPGIKVLLSSGYSIDGQAKDILSQGCNGFIQKPFKIAALSAKLKEIL